jgi:hypothetical protein
VGSLLGISIGNVRMGIRYMRGWKKISIEILNNCCIISFNSQTTKSGYQKMRGGLP